MSIWHLVLIRADIDPRVVVQVAADLEAARAAGELAFDSLATGVRVAPEIGDGIMGGRLDTGSRGEHVLLVRIADEAALETYYAAPAHSVIRRRFLSAVSQECATLYARAEAETYRSELLFGKIERIAQDIMKRIDILMSPGIVIGGANADRKVAKQGSASAQTQGTIGQQQGTSKSGDQKISEHENARSS